MASDQKQSGFVLHSIRTLNQGESNYVKPVRMHFTLNGRTRAWDCLKAHDSVASVIYNKSRNKLIYVKQFRPAVYLSTLTKNTSNLTDFHPDQLNTPTSDKVGYTMELCAGLADKDGKTPQEVMREEIVEETGYDVPLESVKFINSFRGSTGLSGTLMNLFYTEVTDDQKLTRGGGVDDEAIEVMELDIEDARKTVYCRDEDAPYSRPPAMLFGTCWFLNEHLPTLSKQ
jgi:UDP-sugar diphosphatase